MPFSWLFSAWWSFSMATTWFLMQWSNMRSLSPIGRCFSVKSTLLTARTEVSQLSPVVSTSAQHNLCSPCWIYIYSEDKNVRIMFRVNLKLGLQLQVWNDCLNEIMLKIVMAYNRIQNCNVNTAHLFKYHYNHRTVKLTELSHKC